MSNHLPAFTTAFGGGAYATGGRGGTVYHVTNLNNDGVGSLRWAISQPRPAIVVFDVSGIIDCTTKLWITGSDLTIAGQTAPEGGITVTTSGNNTHPQFGNSNNIIIRYVRFRMQFYGDTALTIYPGNDADDEASNIMFDHVSISYAGLQGFTVRGRETHSITFQHGLIAECKTGSLFGDSNPDNVGNSYNNTFRNTLFYNISHRTPNSSSGRADIYNNVVYKWLYRLSTVKTNALVNHFNNFYFLGGRTSLEAGSPTRYEVNGVTNENPSFPPDIYTAGNIVENLFTDPLEDNTQTLWIEHASSGQTERVDPALFRDNPHAMIGRVPSFMTAVESSTAIPADAGAYKYLNADGSVGVFRDPQDTRYVNNTVNDTPESYNNSGATDNRHTARDEQPYADFLASITGTPISTRPANYYNEAKSTDIPEVWFDANVPSGQSATDLAPSGYMWIEEFANQVDGDAVVVNIPQITRTDANPTSIVQGGTYTPPTGTWTDVEDGSGTATVGGDTVDVNTLGTYNVTLFHTDTDGNTGALTIPYTITADVVPPPPTTGKLSIQIKILISN